MLRVRIVLLLTAASIGKTTWGTQIVTKMRLEHAPGPFLCTIPYAAVGSSTKRVTLRRNFRSIHVNDGYSAYSRLSDSAGHVLVLTKFQSEQCQKSISSFPSSFTRIAIRIHDTDRSSAPDAWRTLK